MSKNTDTQFAGFIKTARIKAGVSQADVANALGYGSSQFVSNWERGISMPPLGSLKVIAKMYGINSENLFKVFLVTTTARMRKEFQAGTSSGTKKRRA